MPSGTCAPGSTSAPAPIMQAAPTLQPPSTIAPGATWVPSPIAAIVLDDGRGIDDHGIAELGGRLHDRLRENDAALADFGAPVTRGEITVRRSSRGR